MTGRLLDADSRRVLVPYVVRAVGPFARAIGLLGRDCLEPDAAMWFDRYAAIHTLGMRMSIDVVFLDARGAVLSAQAGVRPWRPVLAARGAHDVVELAAGTIARVGIAPGMRLAMQWNSRISS